MEFDRQVARAVQALAAPEGLRQRVAADGPNKKTRPQFAMATYITAFCGVAIIVALLVFVALDRRGSFPGSEPIARLIASPETMSGLELEPVTNKAGDLGDWFYMRGFDSFALPDELASATALGSRVFKQDGASVAQVAVDWHHAVIYLFRADAFGVELPAGEWRNLRAETGQAMVRKDGNRCTVVVLRGTDPKELAAVRLALHSK